MHPSEAKKVFIKSKIHATNNCLKSGFFSSQTVDFTSLANRRFFNLDQSKYMNNEIPNNESKYYLNALNSLDL